jgi:hypothetical protein
MMVMTTLGGGPAYGGLCWQAREDTTTLLTGWTGGLVYEVVLDGIFPEPPSQH